MSEPLFRGVLPALVTPFRDGAVDEAAFVALVERQIAGGVHGLVPVGTTGETSTLSHDEHRRVVELCVATARGRVPVIAGAGSNSTAEAIELVAPRQGGRRGRGPVRDALLQPAQPGGPLRALPRHQRRRAAAGVRLQRAEPHQRRHLQRNPGASGAAAEHRWHQGRDRRHGARQRAAADVRPGLDHAVGRRSQRAGLHGPRRPRLHLGDLQRRAGPLRGQFFNAALSGDWAAARDWQDRLVRLHKALFPDASPAPTKFALAQLGLCTEDCRLPITACSDAAQAGDPRRHAGSRRDLMPVPFPLIPAKAGTQAFLCFIPPVIACPSRKKPGSRPSPG